VAVVAVARSEAAQVTVQLQSRLEEVIQREGVGASAHLSVGPNYWRRGVAQSGIHLHRGPVTEPRWLDLPVGLSIMARGSMPQIWVSTAEGYMRAHIVCAGGLLGALRAHWRCEIHCQVGRASQMWLQPRLSDPAEHASSKEWRKDAGRGLQR